jgi:ribosomal protein S18 acetylase RimI-like enzyme
VRRDRCLEPDDLADPVTGESDHFDTAEALLLRDVLGYRASETARLPTSSKCAPVSARMTGSTRRRVRQNGERNTMSSHTGSPGVTPVTRIANASVLVTGANRGIGRALVEEALARGAKRVYACTRQPMVHQDQRVTPLLLDLTNAAQIRAAAATVDSLDVLVNNAGIGASGCTRS